MRCIQLGVAKKIKNGARKIVLDKAEEARMAAFSTFKSLGVIVPQISFPLLKSENSVPQVSKVSSGEESCSVYGDVDDKKDSQLVVDSTVEDGRNRANDTVISRGEMLKRHPVIGLVIADVNTVEVFALCHGQHNSITNQAENLSIMASNMTYATDLVPKEQDIICHEGNTSDHMSGGSSDKGGPSNASSVPGGFDSFLDMRDEVKEFCFDVHFTKRSEKHSSAPFESDGVAICWENSRVYYVNLSKDLVSAGRNDFCRVAAEDKEKNGAPTSW